MHDLPPLRMPGATLMTRLNVYGTTAPDGQISGTPHVHLACSEMYVALSGRGAVELLDKDGFSRVELAAHDALLFSPGTIHRLINPDGDFEILVIMQNSGLPERGDNVVTFTDEWLANDERYAEAMTVKTLEDAYRRRDRGVEGFMQLKVAFEESQEAGRAALEQFYECAAARTAVKQNQWGEMIRSGALAAAEETLEHLEQLKQHDVGYLSQNAYTVIRQSNANKLGFCGHLDRYFDPATLMLEGKVTA
ncbi:MAG: cupin domain-containing protein [Anaerolineae bacterium]